MTLFPGDAGAPAVAAVVGDELSATAARLNDLVAHTLVHAAPGVDGVPRFGLGEPVRELAALQLPAADAQVARARWRRWLIGWALALGPAAAPMRVAPELQAVHAVLAGAAADGAPRDALELALALRSYWDTDGLPERIQTALEQALDAIPPAEAALRADVHELLAYLRFEAGYPAEALAHAEAALAAAAADPARRARALVRRAWVELAAGRASDHAGPGHARLQAGLDEALTLARGCGDREAQARALHQLAVLASHVQGDVPRAERLLEESQSLLLALGDRRKAYARLRNRAQCWAQMGREAEAMASYELCERAASDDGDWVGQIDTLLSLATLLAGPAAAMGGGTGGQPALRGFVLAARAPARPGLRLVEPTATAGPPAPACGGDPPDGVCRQLLGPAFWPPGCDRRIGGEARTPPRAGPAWRRPHRGAVGGRRGDGCGRSGGAGAAGLNRVCRG